MWGVSLCIGFRVYCGLGLGASVLGLEVLLMCGESPYATVLGFRVKGFGVRVEGVAHVWGVPLCNGFKV